jgi:hypothetical protein
VLNVSLAAAAAAAAADSNGTMKSTHYRNGTTTATV